MAFLKRLSTVFVLVWLVIVPAFSATNFIVRHIEVQGIQRVTESTVLSYLPVHVGQQFKVQQSSSIIQALYKTGFFSDVQLSRRGNTLIVFLAERPTIGLVQVVGNKAISKKQLQPVLKKLGIVEGQFYDSSKLNAIVQGLQQEYDMLGHYAATVNPQVIPKVRNRVAILIRIKEGPIAKIRTIQIKGNQVFSRRQLLKNFTLTTTGLLSWYTHHNRYSKTQLEKNLQQLQFFYYDHGYLHFRVVSQQVKMTPDRKGVAITVYVYEGPVYRISGYRVAGQFAHDPVIAHLVSSIKTGEVFSRKKVMDINNKIAKYFANQGYAFPYINPAPTMDDKNHQVFLTYQIKLGSRVYVRKVNIVGNARTKDSVIRSQVRQMEASLYSLKKVNESKRRIANLGYLNKVKVSTLPVPGHPDQVDLTYHVNEVNAGRASVRGGYSDVDGFLYGASISEPNFMGTGKYVSLGFQKSAYSGQYNFSYTNPFYTTNGVSRSFSVYYNHTTPGKVNLDPYTMDDYGGTLSYGIPVSEYDSLSVGFGYDHVAIGNVNNIFVSPSVTGFLAIHPSPFNQFKLLLGWGRQTLDRAIFPTMGSAQGVSLTVGAPVLKSSLGFYQAAYTAKWYFPLGYGFVVHPHAVLGYGAGFGRSSVLPFFNNFYGGGISSLPGFEANTLGPKNPRDVTTALGGNVEIIGGINLIFPNPISQKVRTSLILGVGNIFQTYRTPGVTYEGVALKNLRVSTGLMVSWWSPLGVIDFSFAVPLRKKAGDQLGFFGFSFGASL